MSNCEHAAVLQFRSRLAVVLSLKYVLYGSTAWGFLWGTAVLVVRALWPVPVLPLLWGLSAVPVIVGLACVLAVRRLPSPVAVRALLDQRSGCSGLLMTAAECSLGGWQARLPDLASLRVRWHGRRAVVAFAAAVLFVLVSFLVPQDFTAPAAAHGLEIGREVEKLNAQIETLKEEKILEPARAEALRQKLHQLQEEARGESPVKTLEGLDHLERLARQAANEAAEAAVQKTERLSRAETLAEGLRQTLGEIDAKLAAEAMKELGAMMQKAAAETGSLGGVDPAALEACKAGKPNAEQLKKLAAALKGGKKNLAATLKKLRDAELIDAELCKQCEKAGQCNAAALAKFLKENPGNCSLTEAVCACQGGQGGIDEGGGPTPLTWKDASSAEGVKFKEQALPPAALTERMESQTAGVSKGTPPKKEAGGASRPGALQGAAAGGGSAHTQVILPRHRGAVERYFKRPASK